MKIEVGKKYVNERGTVIEIYAKNPYALIFHGANDTSHKVHDADRGMLYVSYFSGGTATPDCPGASKLVPGPRIEWINFSCKCGFKGVAAAKNNVLTCPGCQSQFDLEV